MNGIMMVVESSRLAGMLKVMRTNSTIIARIMKERMVRRFDGVAQWSIKRLLG